MRSLVPTLAVLLAFGQAAQAQVKDAEGFDLRWYGVELCAQCHNEAKPIPAEQTYTSRRIEAHVWLTRDKHKDATLALRNDRSKQMAKLLGIQGDLTAEKRCVSCHGVSLDPGQQNDPKVVDLASYGSAEQRVKSGVSCVACHGPRIKWVKEHAAILSDLSWHDRSRTEKVRDFGMYDLFDPVVRTNLCASCHIGDVDKGRVVTHEMYAAGHPPLPGIEIATFSEGMPAHWEPLAAKLARARALDAEKKEKAPNGVEFVKHAYEIDPSFDEMERTRLTALASLVAVRSSIRLMAKQAEASLKDPHIDDRWPALASYDCYACHHELKPKSWRQERGYRGRPGRIEPRSWPLALGRFGFKLSTGVSGPLAFDKSITPWLDVFQKTPFGAPADVVAEAKNADDLLAAKIELLRKVRFDRAEGKKAQNLLVDIALRDTYDFDSARQLAWALRTISREVDPTFDERLAPIYKSLDEELQLRLPEGQVSIETNLLDAVYGRISTYRPDVFREKMREMQKLLYQSRR